MKKRVELGYLPDKRYIYLKPITRLLYFFHYKNVKKICSLYLISNIVTFQGTTFFVLILMKYVFSD